MRFSDLERYLSVPRLHRYFSVCSSESRAIELYKGNLKLAQAFHPVLGVLEVVTRNSIYNSIAAHFADPDWIINQRNGFMSHRALSPGRFYLKREVERAEAALTRRGVPITSARLVAEQNFKFWTDLLANYHLGLLRSSPLRAFPNLTSSSRNNVAYATLMDIRKFRNRVSHNEPLFLYGNSIDFSLVIETHRKINNVFSWIDPKLLVWIADIDQISDGILACSSI